MVIMIRYHLSESFIINENHLSTNDNPDWSLGVRINLVKTQNDYKYQSLTASRKS